MECRPKTRLARNDDVICKAGSSTKRGKALKSWGKTNGALTMKIEQWRTINVKGRLKRAVGKGHEDNYKMSNSNGSR